MKYRNFAKTALVGTVLLLAIMALVTAAGADMVKFQKTVSGNGSVVSPSCQCCRVLDSSSVNINQEKGEKVYETGLCSSCYGTGRCRICSGSGKGNLGEACYMCSGSGRCYTCSGTGRL